LRSGKALSRQLVEIEDHDARVEIER